MSESNFRSGIRSAVRGLWSGALTPGQFSDALEAVIQRNLTNAWTEGAADCGISADELTDQETTALAAFIDNQFGFIDGYGEAIEAESKAEGGKLTPLFARAEMWVTRYGEARNKAKALACADSKLEWRIDVHCKEHCFSCTRLNGKVKRGSYWDKTILPRSRDLECGGWRCCCNLMATDKSVSKGRLSF